VLVAEKEALLPELQKVAGEVVEDLLRAAEPSTREAMVAEDEVVLS